jgi:non-ribosomal peptide synthetase component F/thioesterase domain-containing protein/acyl carrier protein
MATASKYLFRTSAAVPEPAPTELAANLTASSAEPAHIDFPCSVAQERFWLLDRLEPGNPAYNVAVRWKLEGRISTDLLESAWREIIARHEVLRTRFLEVDGKPVQRVAAHGTFKLVEIDLSSLPEAARSEEGDRIGLIEARAPFDVGTGPLIRVVLLRFSSTSAIILVTTHQIVSDGWSIGVMAREMGAIYQSAAMGEPSSLEPLAIQYGDYAKWQLEWLRQRGIEAETAYWSRQLSAVAPFEVVADRPRPTVPTTNGAIASIVLPRDLTNRMHELSADCGATLFAAAVSILCATLARYTGKSEIVIGTQVSDRDQVELEPMIGQFVNSLILRNDLHGDPRFTELLERTSVTISEALEHKNIPIERLLGMVKAGRGGSNSPPVSVNFIFQRTFIENRQYGALTLEDMPSLPAGAIYDLNFFMVERPDGWRFSCQFNTDQFEASTANRLLDYLKSGLESAVSTPARRISELRLVDPAEAAQLQTRLRGSVSKAADARANPHAITELIAARAKSTPNAVALTAGDRRLSFAQLEAESHRAALLLSARGVGPRTRVGIKLPRSIDLAIAILGVWKAGGAYVALNAEDSLEESQRLADICGASLVVDSNLCGSAATPASNARLPPVDAQSPAAVWFSLGEGHEPVAVEISHSALVERIASLQSLMGATSADVFLSLGPIVAPTLPVELFLPLIGGASVALATTNDTDSARHMQHLVKHARVTRIVCDRSAFAPATIARLLTLGPEVWALHSYAETCGCVSARRIQQAHELRLLGQPLPGAWFRVLDESLKFPPVGAHGELYVGTDFRSLSESAEAHSGRFIFISTEGGTDERLFKTGNAARLRADGVVEIIDEPPREPETAPLAQPEIEGVTDPEMERRLTAIWSELLAVGETQIDANANFFELGGHSLLAARMLARVEAQFGRRVTLASLFRAPSIRGLARLLHSDAREFDFRQMVKLQAEGTNLPLIAINNTGVYYLLAKRLGPQQPVTSLQVFDPSAKHDSLPQTLEEIAAEYVKLIRRVHPSGPYLLAGWCVAGALAFEIARQLTAANERVSNVFLIDSWVPRYFERLPLFHRLIGSYSLRWQLARADWRRSRLGQQTFAQFMKQRPSLRKARKLLARLSGQENADAANEMAAAGPEQYDKWLLEYLQSTTLRYEPKPYSGRVTVLRSRQEPTGWLFDPLAGWGRFAQAGIELAMVDGNHWTMFQDPGATQMAERMAPAILAAQQPG